MMYGIKMVFDQGESMWYASFKCFDQDPWWYCGKDVCDEALLSRVRREVREVDGKISSVLYDSEED